MEDALFGLFLRGGPGEGAELVVAALTALQVRARVGKVMEGGARRAAATPGDPAASATSATSTGCGEGHWS